MSMRRQELALPNTVMFTIATEGYVPFVLNLDASLRRVGLGNQLVAYSLDDKAHNRLSTAGISSVRYATDGCSSFSAYNSAGFTRTVSFKYAVALEILKSGKNAWYTDGDIVFLRNPIDYLRGVIAKSHTHITMQFESPKNVYNTGFWIAAPTPSVIDLISGLHASLLKSEGFTCDQKLFNDMIVTLDQVAPSPYALDSELFACGNQFLEGVPLRPTLSDGSTRPFAMDSAYILHFNYLVGKQDKILAMMKHRAVFAPELLAGSRMEMPPQTTGPGRLKRAVKSLTRMFGRRKASGKI